MMRGHEAKRPPRRDSTPMTLRRLLRAVVPDRWRRGGVIERTRAKIIADAIILGGPFKGMKFSRAKVGSELLPKLLGTYEMELTPVLGQIWRSPLRMIVNVGAAEGYYAVGLAMKAPHARVVAYEAEEGGRAAIDEVARLNHVNDRVEVRGRCELSELGRELSLWGTGFLMVDVEGFEDSLLDPAAIPAMRDWYILFESHDLFIPGIGERICRRFAASHSVLEIRSRPRTLEDIRCVCRWKRDYAIKLCFEEWTHERPAPMSWYFLRPKTKDQESGLEPRQSLRR